MRYVLQSMDILSMAFTGTLEATRVAMYGFDAAVLSLLNCTHAQLGTNHLELTLSRVCSSQNAQVAITVGHIPARTLV